MGAAPGRRVLVVGDQDAECDVLAERLRARGYRVQLVRGVAGACAMLRTTDFDAVLADLPAPDADALAIVRAARRSAPAARVVVLLPAVPGEHEPAFPVLATQAFACLRHPVSFDETEGAISAACEEVSEELETLAERRRAAAHARREPASIARQWHRVLSEAAEAGRGLEATAQALVRGVVTATGALDGWIVTWPGDGSDRVAHAGPSDDGVVPRSLARETRMAARSLTRASQEGDRSVFVSQPLPGITGPMGVLILRTAGADAAARPRTLTARATQISLALQAAMLREGLADAAAGAVRTLAALLDLRDGYAHAHSRRVAELASDLAHVLAVPRESAEFETIMRAALLHDVGVLAVPESVLQKHGPLSEHEWATVRRHPEQGARILRQMPVLAAVAEAVHAARERWDGTGYPRGLTAERIPRAARIVALADAWDAMTSDRPYRPALDAGQAATEIRAGAGRQFDPEVAAAFEVLVDRWSERVEEKEWRETAA
jgi:response regulator RpfG family c-di-GMP phosphodiesterase